MIYTVDRIRELIAPIAQNYGVPAVFLFGSYARGTANEESDIDLLVDTTGTELKSLVSLGALYCELEEAFGKHIDLITVSALNQKEQMPSEADFRRTIMRERVVVYHDAA